MPRRPRRAMSPACFHVINRSVRKVRIFLSRGDYRAFSSVLCQGLSRYPVKLLSYSIMPNHWHLVVGPTDPDTLSRFMRWVTATHAIRWHRHRKTVGQGPVYQGRFRAEQIEGAADLVRFCRYVERNALRAGLVPRAQDWPWGSLADRLRSDPVVPLASAVFLASRAWIDYVNAATTPRELMEEQARIATTSGTRRAKTVENSPVPLDDLTEDPGGLVEIVEDLEDIAGIALAANEDQADAHVERAEHLDVVQPARPLEPAEDGRDGPTAAVD